LTKLKVYGWISQRIEARDHPEGKHWSNQTREIMAATSKAAVARAVPFVTRPRELFNLAETGNQTEIDTALSKIGTIFWKPVDARGDDAWREA